MPGYPERHFASGGAPGPTRVIERQCSSDEPIRPSTDRTGRGRPQHERQGIWGRSTCQIDRLRACPGWGFPQGVLGKWRKVDRLATPWWRRSKRAAAGWAASPTRAPTRSPAGGSPMRSIRRARWCPRSWRPPTPKVGGAGNLGCCSSTTKPGVVGTVSGAMSDINVSLIMILVYNGGCTNPDKLGLAEILIPIASGRPGRCGLGGRSIHLNEEARRWRIESLPRSTARNSAATA